MCGGRGAAAGVRRPMCGDRPAATSCVWLHAGMDKRKTTLHLPAEAHQRLRDASRRTGRSQAALVREALDRYLALEATRPPMPASIGAGDDPDLDARDAKRWLRERWTDRER